MERKTKKRIFFALRMVGNLILLVGLAMGDLYILIEMILKISIAAIVLGILLGRLRERRTLSSVGEFFGIRAKELRESYWT